MGRLMRVVLVAALLAGGIGTTVFGARLYRTWEIARSAEAAGVPDTAGIRGWMTIEYVAATYDVPADSLAERLGVPSAMADRITLGGIARQRGRSPLAIIAEAQRAIADLRGSRRAVLGPPRPASGGERSTG